MNDQGQFYYRAGKSRTRTCTTEPVPPQLVEADVKRFKPDAGRLTVFVVRKRWGDAVNRIDLRVDGVAPVTTVPESFVRLRLAPGRHQFTMTWNGVNVSTAVEGRAGEVRIVEIVGSVWAWGSSYTWEVDDEAGARKRAMTSRLIALRDGGR